MAEVTIYHNPRCSKSRQALKLLNDAGIEPAIIEYLKTPLSPAALEALFARMGLDDVRDAMRKGEASYKDLDLKNPAKTRAELTAAIADNPILLERAIVVGPKGAAICRPPETALTLV